MAEPNERQQSGDVTAHAQIRGCSVVYANALSGRNVRFARERSCRWLARKWRTGMGHDDVELLVDVDDADLNLDAV